MILGGLWMLRRLKRDVLTQLPPLRRVVHRLDDAATEARVDEARATTAFHAAGRAKVRSAAAYVVRRLAGDFVDSEQCSAVPQGWWKWWRYQGL